MISFLNGILAEKHPTRIVVDVGGVGYSVSITLSCYDSLPAAGQPVRVLTCHHVREDSQLLFGFTSGEERVMFTLLLGVSGVGPKVALAILSGLTPAELRAAIADGDTTRLHRAHGVGRKTAERIVLELRDRIDPLEKIMPGADQPGSAPGQQPLVRDAMLALSALGFPDDQARKMLKKALTGGGGPPGDAETLIKLALTGK